MKKISLVASSDQSPGKTSHKATIYKVSNDMQSSKALPRFGEILCNKSFLFWGLHDTKLSVQAEWQCKHWGQGKPLPTYPLPLQEVTKEKEAQWYEKAGHGLADPTYLLYH